MVAIRSATQGSYNIIENIIFARNLEAREGEVALSKFGFQSKTCLRITIIKAM